MAIVDATDCQTMADVRAGVDAVDAELVTLMARRFGYMTAAARIKQDRAAVRDEARKAQVIANVCSHASSTMLPDGIAETLWDQLIEASIAYELEIFDARATRSDGASDGTRTRDLRRDRPAL